MMKEKPILYTRKEDCCGCTACCSICPKSAIIMKQDVEGFQYPYINEIKCISCYRCVNVCPIKNKKYNSTITATCK